MTSKVENKTIKLVVYKQPLSCRVKENVLLIKGTLASIQLQIPPNIQVLVEGPILTVKSNEGKLMGQLKHSSVPAKEGQLLADYTQVQENTLRKDLTQSNQSDKIDRELTGQLKEGNFRRKVIDALKGASEGFVKDIELVGVGFRCSLVSGNAVKEMTEVDSLSLKVGISNTLFVSLPAKVRVSCIKGTVISIFGIQRQDVYHLAAKIRNLIKSDPYKGKGLRYSGEIIRRKEGKKH